MTKLNHLETVRFGVIAGAAGGLAEIAWVTLYAGVTGGNAAVLARDVTTAAGLASLFPLLSAALGVALHMTNAVQAWRVSNPKPKSGLETGPAFLSPEPVMQLPARLARRFFR